jgi:hypothetical protein
MKLEHKRENVVTKKHFVIRLIRYNLFAFGLIAFSLGVGVMGYKLTAHLSWIDSFYMSSMILTGMGPTAEMSSAAAKIFSSFYALYSGVAFLSITAVFFAPIIHRVLHILHVESKE